jgi:hypothetical protein
MPASDKRRIRQIEGILRAPSLRPDGSLIEDAGYDAATGYFYSPDGEFPPVPAEPNLDEARAALEVLRDVLCDFPFVSDDDEAIALSLVLSLVGRPAMRGQVPLHAFIAPKAGTGKGLLANTLSIMATGGATVPTSASGKGETEWGKTIYAFARQGREAVFLDNVRRRLDSAVIDMALTTGGLGERVLGGSEAMDCALRAVWYTSGNGMRLGGDLPRRTLVCLMDAKVEHPEARSGFRHELPDYAHERWRETRVAALTILRAYHCARRPAHGRKAIGSFGDWDRLVRGALLWVGAGDPEGQRDRTIKDADEEGETWGELFEAWHAVHGDAWLKLSDVIIGGIPKGTSTPAEQHEQSQSKARTRLRELLEGILEKNVELKPKPLGDALKVKKGTIYSGLRLESRTVDKKGADWRVVEFPGGES